MTACRCPAIQAADPLRHFTGCPLREPLPEGHLAAGSCMKPGEAGRTEAGHVDPLSARDALDACHPALALATMAQGRPDAHARLVAFVAAATVALRAAEREMAANKGGAS